MPLSGRIAKQKLHAAIDIAANNTKLAAGPDGVIAKKDRKKAVDGIADETERKLTEVFGKLCDHRDAAKGAKLTGKDVDATAKWYKKVGIDAKDENNNGVSTAERKKLSLTGQLAALLVAQRSGNV